ncbi:MAG TPA: hypothetical protein VFP34_02610 [Microlunatus sp.]|nr:hypothetical protein [Microlunatus sp.]
MAGPRIGFVVGLLWPSELARDDLPRHGPDSPPITVDDCPEWTHPVPMILIKDLYNPAVTTRQPPRGNIIYIDPGQPEPYLLGLGRLGVVDLEQNPAYRSGGASDIVIPDREPDRAAPAE